MVVFDRVSVASGVAPPYACVCFRDDLALALALALTLARKQRWICLLRLLLRRLLSSWAHSALPLL